LPPVQVLVPVPVHDAQFAGVVFVMAASKAQLQVSVGA
jgi:hypothetical protein